MSTNDRYSNLPDDIRVDPKFRKLMREMREFEAQGLSGRAQIRQLRGEGNKFSDAEFWRARRQYQSYRTAAKRITHSRLNYLPKKAQIPQSYFTARRWYNWIIEVKGRDRTGAKLTDYLTVTSNRLLSRGAILERAREMVFDELELYSFDPDRPITFTVVEVYRAANLRD